jgi:adenosylcobinamide-phosphate synthase
MGKLLGLLRDRAPTDDPKAELAYGAGMVAVTGNVSVLAVLAAQRLAAQLGPMLGFLADVALLKTTFALRGLLAAGRRVEDALAADDLPSARSHLRALVSRETAGLTKEQVAAAAVESLAENLTDSLDDIANFVPARAAMLLIAVAAPLVGGSPVSAVRMAWRDGGNTASPNAGLTMAAAAGALGVQLEKPEQYRLGDAGRPVDAQTIARARLLVAGAAAVGIALLVAEMLGRMTNRRIPQLGSRRA